MRRAAAALLIALAGTPAAAHDARSAKAFVEGLYAAYAKPPGPDYAGKQAAQVFSPALLDLLKQDAARTPAGEVGTLDGDPICDCQDYEIRGATVSVAPGAAGKAVATARFANFGQAQTVTLDLVWTARGWRVDDVHSEGTPSLAALLRDPPK